MRGLLWGIVASLSYGTADFAARFSSVALGPVRSLFGMLLVGSLLMSVYGWMADWPFVFAGLHLWLMIFSGVMSMAGMLLLYAALARGPITIAAPIASTYPAFVILLLVPLGVLPSAVDWLGMAVVMLGVVYLSRTLPHIEVSGVYPARYSRRTLLIAALSSVCFALQIVSAQEATVAYGALQTAWVVRVVGLAAIVLLMGVRRESFILPLRWWPLLIVQGVLDTNGVIAVLRGSVGTDRAVVAVMSSTFSAVTILLARVFLKERMTRGQWIGIGIILLGIAVLGAAAK